MRVAILKIARDAYRAIGAEGFARIDFLVRGDDVFLSEINTIPGFTPISLFPTMPADGRLLVRRRLREGRRPRARAPRGAGRRHARAGRPAAMTADAARRIARRYRTARPDAAPPAAVRRARPAGPGPGRGDPGDARSARPRSTASPPPPRSASSGSEITRRDDHRRGGDPRPPRARPRARTSSRSATDPLAARLRRSRRSPTPTSRSACRTTVPRRRRRAAADPRLARSATGASRRRHGPPLRRGADDRRRATSPGLPVVTDERVASRALGVGSTLDPVDLDAATPARAR